MRIATFLACVLAGSGCATVTSKGPTTLTDPPMQVTQSDQENAALAFISYTGSGLDHPDEVVDSVLYRCVANELDTQPLTKGKYELVWGPAVFKFSDAQFDDNMMYVVQRQGSRDFVVAIRGTNFSSLSDWIAEDFNVGSTVPWDVPDGQRSTAPPDPRISKATDVGLRVLQTLAPEFSGKASTTVREFLSGENANSDGIGRVTVVGHSLAGALAPAFALWLSDTRSRWDANSSTQIMVTALAGATGGNRDYATYYDSQLGDNTRRIHNPEDVVPLAWNMEDLETLPGLYVPNGINATGTERFLIEQAIDISRDADYAQIVPNAPSLEAGVIDSATTYIEQAAWQHHCGYYCGLGIADIKGVTTPMRPLQSCAGSTDSRICNRCPHETP